MKVKIVPSIKDSVFPHSGPILLQSVHHFSLNSRVLKTWGDFFIQIRKWLKTDLIEVELRPYDLDFTNESTLGSRPLDKCPNTYVLALCPIPVNILVCTSCATFSFPWYPLLDRNWNTMNQKKRVFAAKNKTSFCEFGKHCGLKQIALFKKFSFNNTYVVIDDFDSGDICQNLTLGPQVVLIHFTGSKI